MMKIFRTRDDSLTGPKAKFIIYREVKTVIYLFRNYSSCNIRLACQNVTLFALVRFNYTCICNYDDFKKTMLETAIAFPCQLHHHP